MHNLLQSNGEYGVNITDGSGFNEISFNYFYNNNGLECQALCDDSTNLFDFNYWNNHTAPDTDQNNVVDIVYIIDGEGKLIDNHPLVSPDLNPILPKETPKEDPKSSDEQEEENKSIEEKRISAYPWISFTLLSTSIFFFLYLRVKREFF